MHLELHLVHAFDYLVMPEPIDLVLTIIEEHWTSWRLRSQHLHVSRHLVYDFAQLVVLVGQLLYRPGFSLKSLSLGSMRLSAGLNLSKILLRQRLPQWRLLLPCRSCL